VRGSFEDVAKAGPSDQEKTPSLNAATATLVYDFSTSAAPGNPDPIKAWQGQLSAASGFD
jgi:hypothetical protein